MSPWKKNCFLFREMGGEHRRYFSIEEPSKVLEKNPDINVMIEGHTDNVPYNGTGQVKDNWDLSVMHTTSIVKILLANGKI